MNEFVVKNFEGPKDSAYEGVSTFLTIYWYLGDVESESFFVWTVPY